MDSIFYYVILVFSLLFVFFTVIRRSRYDQGKLPPSPWGLPVIGHLHHLEPLLHRALYKLSKIHGPLMHLRLGAINAIVLSSPEMAKEFLKTHDLTFAHRKHNQAIEHITYEAANPMGPYGPIWIFIKKLSISELLGTHTLAKYLDIRTTELHRFLKTILEKSNTGEPISITKEALKFANNVISQMILGYRCLDEGRSDELLTLVREVTEAFGEFNLSDFLPFLKNIDIQGTKKKAHNIRQRYDEYLERCMVRKEEERKKNKGNEINKSFLDMLIDVVENENSEITLTRNHIKGLLMDYLTAGTDSIAVTLEWAMKEMLSKRETFGKIREEIRAEIGEKRLVNERDTARLPYLQSVIKETLRLHPPIPVILRGSMEDSEVKGYTIERETLLIVNVWAIGRDETVWGRASEFEPERFMSGETVDVKGQHYEMLVFGTGRRMCSGTALAMHLIPLALAAMVQCFDWTGADHSTISDMREKPGITTPPASNVLCLPRALLASNYIL